MSAPRSDHPRRTAAIVRRAAQRLGPVAGVPMLSPVIAAGAPLWAVSALTRWLSRQPLLEPRAFPDDLVEYAPVVGARPRPHLNTHGRGEDVFRLRTDADGWRGRSTLEDAEIVVVGDSFAFGYGVDDRHFYADLDPSLTVKAVASPAYSMVHGLLWMRRLGPQLSGKTVVWFVYCGNDLSDNLRPNLGSYRMPFLRQRADGGWEVATDHVSPEPWTFEQPPSRNDERFVAMCTPSPFSDRVFAAADHLVSAAAEVCDREGASLVVVAIPPTMQVKDPLALRALAEDPHHVDLTAVDRFLTVSCDRHGAAFLPLLPHLRPRHYWHEDMHWNAAGHRLAARVLTTIHRRCQQLR